MKTSSVSIAETNRRLKKHFSQYDILAERVAIISAHSGMDPYVEKIAKLLGIGLTNVTRTTFACKESYICLEESIRHKNVYLFVPIEPNVNARIMETLFFIDALKASEAEEINLIFPVLPYARQDRRNDKREHIATRVLARCFDAIQGNSKMRLITLDLHAPQIESAYRDTHIEPLRGYQLIALYIKKILGKRTNVTLASPDFGGLKRLEMLLEKTGLSKQNINVAFTHKHRTAHNESVVSHIVGDVKDKHVILIDDMIDTGGTIINSAKIMKENGAIGVDIIVTHGYLNGKAIERIATAQKDGHVRKVIITDTIPPREKKIEEIHKFGAEIYMIPTTVIFAEIIGRIQRHMSLSSLYLNTKNFGKLYEGIEAKKL